MSVRQTILDGMLALGVVAVLVANRPGSPSNTYNPSPNAYTTASLSQDATTPPNRSYTWDGVGWVVR